jgi:anti-anti-sigma factor
MQPHRKDCSLEVESRQGADVARFAREVVLSGSPAEAAGEQLMALVSQPGRRLLVDFGNVKSLSSLMLGKLLRLNRAAQEGGGRLALFNLRPDVREILEVTGLNRILALYASEQEALQGS